MTPARPRRSRPDLARLTGVRSGKGSYYRAYVASDERVQRAVVAGALACTRLGVVPSLATAAEIDALRAVGP